MILLQITATFIKIIGIIFQYGLLVLLLLFVYKVLRYMQKDVKPLADDVYADVEITNGEAVLAVVETGDDNLLNKSFAFSSEIIIGRNAGCDIVITDSFVSHRHARIMVVNNQYVLEDMGSANGTFLNGQQLPGRGKSYLQVGDSISIGTVTFEFAR